MIASLKFLPRYLRNFDLFYGFFLWIQVELLKRKSIKLKGFRQPVYLRPDTTDLLVFREVFLFNSYDLDISPPSVIIDGGANIGLASLFLTRKFPNSKIYSIEPGKSNFEILVKNAYHHPLITPIQSALWNVDSFLKIVDNHSDHWALNVKSCGQDEDGAFQGLSLSSVMKQYNIDRIDFLKLDIEGAERELFTDNYDFWLNRTKHIVIELHDWMKPDCSRTVFRTLSEYHFTTMIFNGMLFLTNQRIK